jgi:hypothetical protein
VAVAGRQSTVEIHAPASRGAFIESEHEDFERSSCPFFAHRSEFELPRATR